MIGEARSRNGALIRLTAERWSHIMDEHRELEGLHLSVLETVSEPETILAGGAGELLAVRPLEPEKWMVVAYRETDEDGFVITAFLTRRSRSLSKRTKLWP